MSLRKSAPLFVVLLLALAFSASAQAAGGTAKVWGYGPTGDLPVNKTSGCFCVEVPTDIPGMSEVVQITGGYTHVLGLRDDGTVLAWGNNDEGQLGDGTTTDRPSAVQVPGLSNVVALAGSEDSSMALLADGSVRVWGNAEEGNLGNGNVEGPEDCDEKDFCSKVPIPVPGVSDVVAISQGEEFSLALRADGTVLAWGKNRYGTLGDGIGIDNDCDCVPTPTQIAGLSGVVAISAGEEVASALLLDGTVRNWGSNKEGELGTGIESATGPCFCLAPTAPTGVTGARQVSSGAVHSLALLSSGAAMGWGENEYGQIGLGFASTTGCKCITTPTQIPGLAPETVSAGYSHSQALMPDGTGQSWGSGYYGELSNGESGDGVERHSPGPILGLSGASELTRFAIANFALIGPKRNLKVEFAGAGSGKVAGNNILCPPSCSSPKPQGQPQILRALPDPGSGFTGFTGGCAGTGVCQVKMGADQTVTATFGPPKGTAITSAVIKGKKKKTATFSFSAPGVVTGYECKLIKPKPKKKKKGKGAKRSAKKGKAKPAQFVPCSTPAAFKNLLPGKYTFEARALNALGTDAVPASRVFKIKKPKPKAKKKIRK